MKAMPNQEAPSPEMWLVLIALICAFLVAAEFVLR